jgi:hypothetical protein
MGGATRQKHRSRAKRSASPGRTKADTDKRNPVH